jgi:hypothetical protein
MITLRDIHTALERLDAVDGDTSTEYIESAIDSLETASEALNTIAVRGRANVDALLGIMMGIDMLLGKEDKHG